MIIFGQGAIRCHPYAYKEMEALENGDVTAFDKAFTSHIGHVVRNASRAFLLSITRGRLAKVPKNSMTRYYQKLSWASASFAFLSDVAMGTLGGSLKFREKITGRFADILSWMYLITSVLRRFEAEGRRSDHAPFVHYAVRHGFVQIQQAFNGLYANLNVPILGPVLRYPVSLWSRMNSFSDFADDQTGAAIARAMMTPGAMRDSLTARSVYIPKEPEEPVGRLEHAFNLSVEAEGIMKKVHKAVKEKVLKKAAPSPLLKSAKEKGIITQEEYELVGLAMEACRDAIEVDTFALEEYRKGVVNAVSQDSDELAPASNA